MMHAYQARDRIIVPTPAGQTKYEFTLFAPGAVSAVAIILIVLTTVFVGLRFYSRRMTGIGIKGDDWTVLAALICAMVLCSLCVADTVIGSRPDEIDYIFNVVVPATSLGLASTITVIYASVLALIKISMLLLYKRIFTQKWLHHSTSVLIALTCCLWGFFIAAITIFSVRLYRAYHGGTDRASWTTTQAALILDVVLDGIILILPTPIVWKLKMTFGRKIQVLALFAVGSLWMIASAVRLIYLSQSVYTTHVGDDSRFLEAVRASFYFTIAATCVGICHACLPTLRPLIDKFLSKNPRFHSFLRRFSPSRLTSRSRSYGRSGNGYQQGHRQGQTPRSIGGGFSAQKVKSPDPDRAAEIAMVPISIKEGRYKTLPEIPSSPTSATPASRSEQGAPALGREWV